MLDEKKILMEKIENVISRKSTGSGKYFQTSVNQNIIFLIMDLFLTAYMIFLYREYRITFNFSLGMFVLTLLLLVFSLNVRKKIRGIYDFDQPVSVLIETHVSFFNQIFQIWQYLKPLSLVIATVAISAIVDFDNSEYRINNKLLYAFIFAFIYVFVYLQERLFSIFKSAEYLQYLKSLGSENNEYDLEGFKKRAGIYRYLMFLLVMALLLSAMFIYCLANAK